MKWGVWNRYNEVVDGGGFRYRLFIVHVGMLNSLRGVKLLGTSIRRADKPHLWS